MHYSAREIAVMANELLREEPELFVAKAREEAWVLLTNVSLLQPIEIPEREHCPFGLTPGAVLACAGAGRRSISAGRDLARCDRCTEMPTRIREAMGLFTSCGIRSSKRTSGGTNVKGST
jgi:hypothetical protein